VHDRTVRRAGAPATDEGVVMAAPGALGFRLASDRVPHERCVMRWPSLVAANDWRGHLGAARDTIAIIARAIAELEPVLVVTDVGEGRAAEMWLGDSVEVVELPGHGGWMRDAGPLFVVDAAGHRIGVVPTADAEPDRVATKLCAHLGIECVEAPLAVEGGALVSDGAGRAIATTTTAGYALPDIEREAVARELAEWLGIDDVVWLRGGPSRHVDTVVGFVDEGHVLLQTTDADADRSGAGEPGAGHRAQLEAAGLRVDVLDALPHDQVFGETHAVPFVNLYHANGGVFVPLSGAAVDREILHRLQGLFPTARIIGVPGRILAFGGGGIRRLTLPVPA